ncbi:FAD-binding protein [Calidifontibacter indicus]|uniref:FAD binding domain-containing protein n=1 Tax=Calidifontibacter indicus TaxID=419650 RepID=A0A3D9URE5_9MICO|nr:FAD binding domain-containing protein [Calidifontibacter indicus]
MNAYEAVVVGGGHHGLLAAIELADHGRQVLLSRP